MAIKDRVCEALKAENFFVKGSKVLDLGCGRFAVNLAFEEIDYYGVDVESGLVKTMAIRVPQFHFRHMDIFNNLYNPTGRIFPHNFKLPYADGFFDAVICKSVFTHLGDEKSAQVYAAEIERVLKPGGKLFSTWFSNPPNDLSCYELRTVYPLTFIFECIKNFDHKISKEQTSLDFNDQLEIISVKR